MGYVTAFHNIIYEQSLTFENKVTSLLQLGLKIFNVDVGMVVRSERTDLSVLFTECKLAHRKVENISYPIKSFCKDVVSESATTSARHSDKNGTILFIGTPIVVDLEVFGVITFISANRSRNYSQAHLTYLEMFTKWLGNTLAYQQTLDNYKNRMMMLNRLESVAKVGAWEVDLLTSQISWSEQTKVIHEVPPDYVPNLETAFNFYKEGTSRDAISNAIERAILAGSSWELELELITAKNSTIWVKANGIADFQGGQCVRLFGTLNDITQEVKHRQHLKAQVLNHESKV